MEQGLDDFHTEVTPEIPLEAEQPSGPGFWHFVRDVLETLVLSVLLFLAINTISARIRVDGSSMVPTLQNGEFVMVNRLAYRFGDPGHGDVVVFHYPRDPEQEFIKRIIGLPGDTVRITGGDVFINGEEISEPYIAAAPRSEGEWLVPDGHVFVLGDNRNNSQDSRNFGYVTMDNVIGKALFIYWPPDEWGMVKSAEHSIPAAPAADAYP